MDEDIYFNLDSKESLIKHGPIEDHCNQTELFGLIWNEV
jgi:hypothetical protein